MTNITEVPVDKQSDLTELFRLKGELVTQLEIAQGKLQQVNFQIQQVLNQAK